MNSRLKCTATALVLFLSGCSAKTETIEIINPTDFIDNTAAVNTIDTINNSQLIGVTGFDIMLNNAPAVGVAIGIVPRVNNEPSSQNFVEVTTLRSLIAADTTITATANNNANISISTYWRDQRYVQSTAHDTHVTLRILSLDRLSKTGFISVQARLVDLDSGEFIHVEQEQVVITGQDFINLVGR
ncbi:hypothetical protein FR932_13425 [Moritella marina ATCC 15381]|uniref:Penicillin-binding protein activator LpoB n=2 Tax=Moritella marina TaxID=90736 RepID=A0A5J6WQ46_MORMI|nr:hypothetical protein [Moritella marina]QFI40293.1 hypothetical protein FR932_13425 [Moritella marina ATCC 15381]